MGHEHELTHALREYAAFLASSHAPGAQHWSEKLRAALLESDVVAVARKVLSFYGGMGSINDIVFPFGSPERQQYHDLGERLYQIAKESSRRGAMTPSSRFPTSEGHGWALVSAEGRSADHPDTFEIPSHGERSSLLPGDGAKLLFDIETRENGRVIDRGVDRMWVIVRSRREGRYLGVLDSDPGTADGLLLHAGDEIVFGPEHVAAIGRPPRAYVVEKYGADFFVE